MKAKKAKSNKKVAKKNTSRAAKKELEATITDKFMGVIVGLGHDASKIGKDIKKASKQLAKKLADKFQNVKKSVAEEFENTTKTKSKAIKKPLTSAKMNAASKAEKVVAKAAKVNTDVKPAKRAYTRRAVAVTAGINGEAKAASAKKPKAVSKTTTAKPASGRRRVASKRTPKDKPEETVIKAPNAETSELNEQNPQEQTNNTF